MRRWIAVLWHASFLIIAAALYFFFVLPRWFELTGQWSSALGLSMRILCGALIGLAALPVVFTLLRTRKPEFGTPQLALTLRFWAIVLHVLAGVLILGTAISELWFSLDDAGAYLFGVYGAAAAIALLGALGFYLAFTAELPPPPPKPLRPKTRTRGRGRGKRAADDDSTTDDEITTAAAVAAATQIPDSTDDPTADGTIDENAAEDDPSGDDPSGDDPSGDDPVVPAREAPVSTVTIDEDTDYETPPDTETSTNGSGNAEQSEADDQDSKVRNRRPGGKSTSRPFGRSRR